MGLPVSQIVAPVAPTRPVVPPSAPVPSADARRTSHPRALLQLSPLTTSITGIALCSVGAKEIGGVEAPDLGESDLPSLDRHIDLRQVALVQLVPRRFEGKVATAHAALSCLAVDFLQQPLGIETTIFDALAMASV